MFKFVDSCLFFGLEKKNLIFNMQGSGSWLKHEKAGLFKDNKINCLFK